MTYEPVEARFLMPGSSSVMFGPQDERVFNTTNEDIINKQREVIALQQFDVNACLMSVSEDIITYPYNPSMDAENQEHD